VKRLCLLLALASCSRSKAHHYDLADISWAEYTGGLPMHGAGEIVVDLSVDPKGQVEDWSKVTGSIEVTCAGCVLGDDRAKLAMPSKLMGGGALEFGHLAIGTITGGMVLAGGNYQGTLTMSSADLEVEVEAHGHLARRLGDSTADGCIAFRPTQALEARSPQTFALLSVTGATQRADGFFTIALSGTVHDLRRFARDCSTR
jgi:hypothetical protein